MAQVHSRARSVWFFQARNFSVLSIFCAGPLFFPSCASRSFHSNSGVRIWGGSDVTATDTFSSALVRLKGTVHDATCSGILIHPQVILTAAHCLEEPVEVRLGFDQRQMTADMQILEADYTAISHADFAESYDYGKLDNDIALIFLKSAVPSRYGFVPLSRVAASSVSIDLAVIGYGRTNTLDSTSLARKADVTVEEYDAKAGRIFVKTGDGNVLKGDSGGPLLSVSDKETSVVGISIAAGKLNGTVFDSKDDSREKGSVGVMNDVFKYADWIDGECRKRSIIL